MDVKKKLNELVKDSKMGVLMNMNAKYEDYHS